MDWSTMFLTFLVGSSFTLVAVLALVLKTSRREVSGSLLGNTERKRCKEPSGFGGRTEDFAEWLFSVQEALRTLQPADPVGYVASFLEGNARKWLISSWGPDGSRRPRDWLEFKSQLTNAFQWRIQDLSHGGAWNSKTPKLVIATRSRRGPALAPSRGVRGHAPPGNFENWDAQICIFHYFGV